MCLQSTRILFSCVCVCVFYFLSLFCTYHPWAWGHTCTCSCHCPCPWCWSRHRGSLDCSVCPPSHCDFSGTAWNTSRSRGRGGGGRRKPGSQGMDAHHGWWRGERSAVEWLACAIKTARRHNMLHGMSPEGHFVLCCDWVKVEHLEKHYEGRRKIK